MATVTAFGSADSHDEHYFGRPGLMIRGRVDDPLLTLDNADIARRHVTAFLLQRYHQERLPTIRPEEQPQLFAVLGSVADFENPTKVLNRDDFEAWLRGNEHALTNEVDTWLPQEIGVQERRRLLESLVVETLRSVDTALDRGPAGPNELSAEPPATPDDSAGVDGPSELGEDSSRYDPGAQNLLDRLLYKGVLPRYAFPTDVATFYVFDPIESTPFRPVCRFTPSQGLPVALSQYAPGKEVWIAGKLWTSGAIYSAVRHERYKAWETRRLYYECSFCHYASTVSLADGVRGDRKDCEACGGSGTFGPARYWLRPPGFAHRVDKEEGTSPDDAPARSYATRAKLTAPTPVEADQWQRLSDRVRIHHAREHLLVTNRGPSEEGYTYCTKCGLIEPTIGPTGIVGGAHRKPYPAGKDPSCAGGGSTKGMVLGTDFITDVLLLSFRVDAPVSLRPGILATDVALRTLSEALTKAACAELGLEASELQAEYRPALTSGGREGLEAEIYVYDTLPGGAGFARRVGGLGLAVLEAALRTLEECPEGCDRSCYRCLRSYKNKFEHDLLDRHLGAALLRYLLGGDVPALPSARLEQSTNTLFEDLSRQASADTLIVRNREITLPGLPPLTAPIYAQRGARDFVVALHGPLTPGTAPTEALRLAKEYSTAVGVILVDELVVRRNLPGASRAVLDRVT